MHLIFEPQLSGLKCSLSQFAAFFNGKTSFIWKSFLWNLTRQFLGFYTKVLEATVLQGGVIGYLVKMSWIHPPPRGLGVCTPPFNITMGVLYKYNFYHAETHTGVSQYTHYLTPPSYSFPLQGGAILPMLDLPPPLDTLRPLPYKTL